jgi:hypothetical protein
MRDALFGPTHNQRIIEDVRSRMASKLRETAVGTKISGPGTADDDDGEEMEMLGHFMSDKDPLTKRPIRQPVKNPVGFILSISNFSNLVLTRFATMSMTVNPSKNTSRSARSAANFISAQWANARTGNLWI